MEERTIIVKKGECLVEKLVSELKKHESAWAFLNTPVVEQLAKQSGYKTTIGKKCLFGLNKERGAKRNASICLQGVKLNDQDGWSELMEVSASDIEFKESPQIPEAILLFKMEE